VYVIVRTVDVGRVLCTCVNEWYRDWEGVVLEDLARLSYIVCHTREHISLTTDSARGWGLRLR
jgi:hypothetical protein